MKRNLIGAVCRNIRHHNSVFSCSPYIDEVVSHLQSQNNAALLHDLHVLASERTVNENECIGMSNGVFKLTVIESLEGYELSICLAGTHLKKIHIKKLHVHTIPSCYDSLLHLLHPVACGHNPLFHL